MYNKQHLTPQTASPVKAVRYNKLCHSHILQVRLLAAARLSFLSTQDIKRPGTISNAVLHIRPLQSASMAGRPLQQRKRKLLVHEDAAGPAGHDMVGHTAYLTQQPSCLRSIYWPCLVGLVKHCADSTCTPGFQMAWNGSLASTFDCNVLHTNPDPACSPA